ncbi:MAG: LCP family protein [Candidatus Limivivens sp.]|nr:LCP family protein [Candidatus Limivivens sp.]
MKKPIDKNSPAYKKHRRRKWIFTLEILVLLCLMVYAAYYVVIQKKLDSIQIMELPVDEVVINEEVETDPVLQGETFTNIALFGLDTRDGNLSQANSDTMIIVTINHKTKEIRMASVYRDTLLDVGGGNLRKSNSAYSMGGPRQAVEMLNTNLDLNIKDYISVDMRALVTAIDALGGLEITVTDEEAGYLNDYCVETTEIYNGEIYDRSNDLPGGGTYLMNGIQAVAYTRIRYTAGNDFKRTERQREVIGLIAQKAKTAGIGTLNKVANEVFPMILTSYDSLSLISLGMKLLTYDIVETTGFPFTHLTSSSGSYNEVPVTLESNVIQLHEFLFGRTDYSPSAAVLDKSYAIINATGYSDPSAASSENYGT